MKREDKPRILLVEDEGITARFVSIRLASLGFGLAGHATSGEVALQLAMETAPDLVLMDVMLDGELDGIETAIQLQRSVDVPVIFLTCDTDAATIERAKATHPYGYLVKPFNEFALKTTIEIALHRHRNEAIQRLHTRAIDASASAIFILDARQPGAPIVQVNPAFERMTGYPAAEVIGQSCQFLEGAETDRATSERLRLALHGQTNAHVELLHYRKDGAKFWSEVTLAPVPDGAGRVSHLVGIQDDLTSYRKMEAQLRQSQKLESIGQLAAGIAHEINTPTQYIGDNTRFLEVAFAGLMPYFAAQAQLLAAAREGRITEEVIAVAEAATEAADIDYLSTEIPSAIQQSLQGIERVTRIVAAMKKFSHPGTEEKVLTDINEAIENTLAVCRNEWKYIASVGTELDPNLPAILGFPGELNQAFLNLIVNACHAIADVVGDSGQKGKITITTRQLDDHVEIRISDTGTGIPAGIRHRIFDPFFTTKGTGKGTGQGLAIAWSAVIDKHRGRILVESEPGQGATFIVQLPVQPPPCAGQEQVA